ncbi:40S ribosomal protein S23 [Galemys pyrenaicus]|uniref:Small ribosomal subunit protein uS12 n=1 Tax=Galemys pyrenaicus TaxID=202257 RepID=A0A8J6DKG1_GALPY|nr:40S ribosomal protein S23 [Galemys pyrenaicus]
MGKCRGLRTARKLRSHRRDQKWHDKPYKKAHLGTALKANPFGGTSHVKGIVLEKVGVEAKQPNSAIRKCVRVQLIKNGKKITVFVPNDGCLNFIEENDEVPVAGFGRKGHAVGDIPGVRFKIMGWPFTTTTNAFIDTRKVKEKRCAQPWCPNAPINQGQYRIKHKATTTLSYVLIHSSSSGCSKITGPVTPVTKEATLCQSKTGPAVLVLCEPGARRFPRNVLPSLGNRLHQQLLLRLQSCLSLSSSI